MFTVYRSNKLDILLLKSYEIIKKKPLSNIFHKEIFINDNKVLSQYINIFLANQVGISANLKFYRPDEFIWELFELILIKKKIKNIFTKSSIIFKIMKIIDENFFLEYVSKKDHTIKKFKFSFLMAQIFEKYIIYRPNWINRWEQGEKVENMSLNQEWQMKLWNKLIKDSKKNNQTCLHFANLFFSFQFFIDTQKIQKHKIPNRFFIISCFSLNPYFIKIFKLISKHIDVYLLHVTPCKKNMFNLDIIKNNNDIFKKKVNDSLIDFWGQYEKMYELHIFNSNTLKLINIFKKNYKCSILNNIKNDILTHSTCNQKKKKRFLSSKDHSISINICCNKKHEIEVLYQSLLVFLDNNLHITPRDIVVVSTEIDSYTQYINTIFKSQENKKQIPFFISKKHSKKTKIIISVFHKILNLSNSRFNNEEILELLDVPEIAMNFNISEDEIDILYHWVEKLNIRWGVDEKHKEQIGFPKNNQNTWLYGIEKLFFHYSINDTKSIDNNIFSYMSINNSRSELIGKLSKFINTLNKWRKKLLRSHLLKYWHSLSASLIKDFFYKTQNIEHTIEIINMKWINMINDHLISNYKKRISIEILKKNFYYICNNTHNKKFLPGVINFCHPDSICYIPFKIICIIGEQYKNINQKKNIDNFNFLNNYQEIGDEDVFQKNCYLFLQHISCAEQFLYLSYIGYSVENKIKKYPSIYIDQLFNYILHNFCFKNDKHLTIEQNKKKVFNHIFKIHNPESLYIKKVQNKKHNKILFNKNIHFKKTLIKNFENKIQLKDLIFFWSNPIRYFLNFQLNIQFNLKKKNINITEPFLVDKLDQFKINSLLLEKLIKNQDIKILFKQCILSGMLPYGFFGKVFWDEQVKEMKKIANLVIQYRIQTKEQKIDMKVKKYQLCGILSEIQKTGLLRWKTNTINYNDRISLWLEHLIYSALGGVGESKIIGYKNQIWCFNSLNSNLAYSYLLNYIEGYIKGTQELLFLTKSGSIWVDQVYDIKNQCIKTDKNERKNGYKKLLNNWMGNNFYQGEKEDFYIQQTISELNLKNIKNICKTAEKWLIPILKHKKDNKLLII